MDTSNALFDSKLSTNVQRIKKRYKNIIKFVFIFMLNVLKNIFFLLIEY